LFLVVFPLKMVFDALRGKFYPIPPEDGLDKVASPPPLASRKLLSLPYDLEKAASPPFWP